MYINKRITNIYIYIYIYIYNLYTVYIHYTMAWWKKPKPVAVMIFNYIYIIKVVLDCKIIYILLIIGHKGGASSEQKIACL